MSDWQEARLGFFNLLDEIERTKEELRCSLSSAWYRGESKAVWRLIPSIFRGEKEQSVPIQIHTEIGNRELLFSQREREHNKKKILNLLEKENDFDRLELLKNLFYEENKNFEQLQKYEKQFVKLTTLLKENSGFVFNDLNLLKKHIEDTRQTIGKIKVSKNNVKRRIDVLAGLHFGEKDTYVAWTRRSGNISNNSWIVLTEMQHYGVPTRLLDWTENLAIALYFAVEPYYLALHSKWHSKKSISERKFFLPELDPVRLHILNPYELAREATGLKEITDVTGDKNLDYYTSFFKQNNWNFKNPIPIYPPMTNPRIKAQQGMFTVHGSNRKSFDDQFDKSDHIFRSITIQPLTAIYIAKHLMDFGIDEYYVYQDFDRLGKKTKQNLRS